MRDYLIVTDSSADLTAEQIKEFGIASIPLDVVIDGNPIPNDKVDVKEVYAQLRAKKTMTTSAATIQRFTDFFEEILKDDVDLLYLGFSSGLSSTYSSGAVALKNLQEKYPDRKLYAVDTLCASLGQGLLVYHACQEKAKGKTIEEVRDWTESNKLNLAHWFTVDDLFFLKRGGRVSATSAVVGTMLSIKPVMHMDNAGKLIPMDKVRGRKTSIDALVAKMKNSTINPIDSPVFISHGDCIEDAEYLASKIKNELGIQEVVIGYVGPVIGSHSGPGTLALFFLAKER
ncbi:MAG: DegV family protein [Ruminococcaceae bacterium]|nr:DegV family protein [Oscillospiraceae bacterium]